MIGWLRRRLLGDGHVAMTLSTDGMVVCLSVRVGWLDAQVRMVPDDARKLGSCLVMAAHEADAYTAEAIA